MMVLPKIDYSDYLHDQEEWNAALQALGRRAALQERFEEDELDAQALLERLKKYRRIVSGRP